MVCIVILIALTGTRPLFPVRLNQRLHLRIALDMEPNQGPGLHPKVGRGIWFAWRNSAADR